MYNLIMQGGIDVSGASIQLGLMEDSRLFEHTSSEIIQPLLALEEQARLEKLRQFPCLFTDEIQSAEGKKSFVRTGRLLETKITHEHSRRCIELTCQLDDLPCIDHNIFKQEGEKFGITGPFGFNRFHWAVKDVDLFKVLYEIQYSKPPLNSEFSPFKFQSPNTPLVKKVAVMMPFNTAFNPVYKVIKETVKATGYPCIRVDDVWNKFNIVQSIIDLIDTSEIVICVYTGSNANVFYEMGIAHTLGRKVIPIAEAEDSIPFDVSTVQHVLYGKSPKHWCKKFRNDLKQTIDNLASQA